MKRLLSGEIILSLVVLALAGLAPNLFPAAQAGVAKLSWLGKTVLIPSLTLLAGTLFLANYLGYKRLVNRTLAGAGAGILATLALELVRATSFHMGGMPGDMPRLLGVLLTDRFMQGPSLFSDILGWSYHFWNGAVFGIIFAVVFGPRPMRWFEVYGFMIGLGFLVSPAVASLGIGFLGLDMPAMPLTVILAHVAYSAVLGRLTNRWVEQRGWLLSPVQGAKRESHPSAMPRGTVQAG